jgi:hypothetical protein
MVVRYFVRGLMAVPAMAAGISKCVWSVRELLEAAWIRYNSRR